MVVSSPTPFGSAASGSLQYAVVLVQTKPWPALIKRFVAADG
jgi:hypothetical protein